MAMIVERSMSDGFLTNTYLVAAGPALVPEARAQPAAPSVLLLRRPSAPPHVAEALVRLSGELAAEGFTAEVREAALGADVRADLDRLAPTVTATAIVTVVPGNDPASAELWVLDRVTGKTVVRRVRADAKGTSRSAEVLSVHAVELLRASFLELIGSTTQTRAEAGSSERCVTLSISSNI